MTVVTTIKPATSTPAASRETDVAPLIELRDAVRTFGKNSVHAVDHVDLAIAPREVVGLVGESGCGKSTLGRLAVGLLPLSAGERRFHDEDVTDVRSPAARAMQLRVQMLLQDPRAALDPRLRVIDIVGEAPVAHGLIQRRQKIEYVGLQLNRVGLDPMLMQRFPHEFSDGQRVRIGVARALAVRPELLVCDDVMAGLDISVQAQLINVFVDLRASLELTYLFMSHDLSVVKHVSDRVMIMYLGRVVETAPAAELCAAPAHPYTRALVGARGGGTPAQRTFVPIRGEIPSAISPPRGCHFHPRCPHAMDRCRDVAPRLVEIAPDRWAACHLHEASPTGQAT